MKRYLLSQGDPSRRSATITLNIWDDSAQWEYEGNLAPEDGRLLSRMLDHWATTQATLNPITGPRYMLKGIQGYVISRTGPGPNDLIYGKQESSALLFDSEQAHALCALVSDLVMVPHFGK